MRITFFDIYAFRRLQNCRIELDNQKTIFVGANNSGKTSAFDAINYFLSEVSKFSITDIPLSYYDKINAMGRLWKIKKENIIRSLNNKYCPHLDIWLDVSENELQYCYKIIPSLDWDGGSLGVRVQLTADISSIYEEYMAEMEQNKELKLIDFLNFKFKKYLKFKYFVLNPKKENDINQEGDNLEEVEDNPLKTLIKLDVIFAQRSFYDISEKANSNKLSNQLAEYYDSQFNPRTQSINGISGLYTVIKDAEKKLSGALEERYEDIIKDLSNVNYPNIGNPDIILKATIPVKEAIANSQSVRYKMPNTEYTLPENSNGLGYQNLVSMSFKLMQFRDDWIKKETNNEEQLKEIEPIHLVLVEEPEAHLHPQSQTVFIKNAYSILTKSKRETSLTSQLIVTTHSSHIAYEVSYCNIRYFKRNIKQKTPSSTVISLKGTFDKEKIDDKIDDKIEKFVQRYLKLFHADIFFADGVILLEGAGERILTPAFIENDIPELNKKHLSVIEIGGSHAHRLLPLMEKIKIPTLIITDIDPVDTKDKKKVEKPEKGKEYITSNPSIIKITEKNDFDELLSLTEEQRTKEDIHIAYQLPQYDKNENEKLFFTFEDALIEANKNIKYKESHSIIRNTFEKCLNSPNETKNILKKLNKAEFATELLYQFGQEIKTPPYFLDGLKWLNNKLKR